MKKMQLLFLSTLITFSFFSCKKTNINKDADAQPSVEDAIMTDSHGHKRAVFSAGQHHPDILATNALGFNVFNGGYGSSLEIKEDRLFRFGKNDLLFYYLTDRGPNVAGFGGLLFPVPAFNPQIGVFKLFGDSLFKVATIHLKNKFGALITGLPNPVGLGATGEVPFDVNGHQLPADPYGLDTEGLTIMEDGTFWISDEYGPHIVHFNGSGREIERINPFGTGTGGRTIPKVFATRRINRGMEGLTSTPNQKWLVGMMQSPLDNPNSTTPIRNSGVLRILFFNIVTGATKQYLYKTEGPANLACEIKALSNNEFLVLERDGNFPLPGNPASSFKRVYKININGATDISDPANGAQGKLINGKPIEQAAATGEPGFSALIPVTKTLVTDIIVDVPGYAHDKPEGIALIGNSILAVCNDDDFSVIDNGAGSFMPKYLPYFNPQKVIDRGRTYFISLKNKENGQNQPLHGSYNN